MGRRREKDGRGRGAAPPRACEPPVAPVPPVASDAEDEDDPRHEAVLATRPPAAPEAGELARPRRDLAGALPAVRLEVLALVVLALAPSVLGLPGLLAGLGLVAASRFWSSAAKLAASFGMTALALLFSVVVAWLRATQVSEAEGSRTRISIAWHALADSVAALPVGVGWLAATYLGYVLVRRLTEDDPVA